MATPTKLNIHKLPYIKIKNAVLTSTPSSQEETETTTTLRNFEEGEEGEANDKMSPKPYDDLFIEPAGDYDVVYGDYNSTMDDSTGKRPYLRLTSALPNVTRSLGGEIRLKCEAAGAPLPIQFSWLKNNAPIEKNRRTKIKNKEYFSKLIISDLDVLDSGYYQCSASNVAGSVNTTAVLRVNTQTKSSSSTSHSKNKQHSQKPQPSGGDLEDYGEYDSYDDMSSSGGSPDRGRLPVDEEQDLYRVPSNAAGNGYVPLTAIGGQDRWLDGITLRVGDCILYQGDACRNFLNGKHIMITSESREALYDIDRELRAAMMFIQHIPDLSTDCKRYSHAVACYHMYKVCDQTMPSTSTTNNKVISLCRKDCDSLKDEVCPKGFSMAAQHELVGDGPKALLPHCTSLSENAGRCLRVLEPIQPPPPLTPKDKDSSVTAPHWCYVDTGKKYEGSFSEAISGRRCLPWSQVDDDTFNVDNFPQLNKAKNHCRNPGGNMKTPWCFTSPNGQKELCDIPNCPKNMYPEFGDDSPMTNSNSGVLDAINNTWNGMPSHLQFASMAGLGGLAVLLLFLLFCCCCRKRKSSSSTSSSVKKGSGFGVQSCNGSSIVTSGMNSNYARKYPNQGLPGGHLPHSYEMNALLPNSIPPSSQNTGYGMQGAGSGYMLPPHQQHQQQQYSPPTTEPPVEPFHIRQIPPLQINIDKILGEGAFTLAYVGEYREREMSMPIVIKTLKKGSSHIERETFEDEIQSIASFDHQNIIQLLGISYLDNQTISAIFDYNCHGDLHEFLKVREPLNPEADEKEKIRNFEDFFRIGGQIASGMEFLARMGHVHRDLATRNCLVGDQQIIRICDFASMRQDYERDYYILSTRSRVPLRWLSKEALEDSRYTIASDVYAFGVTLWELYTFGRQPYEGYSDHDVIRFISMHEPLPCPNGCPSNVYRTMVECWNEVPERRPSFSELHSKFQKWCINGPQLFMNNQNRANSTHSGGSSGNNRQQSSSSHSLQRNPYNNIPDPYQVPPPAPLMHSTPIGPSYLSSTTNNSRSPKGKRDGGGAGIDDTSPLMRQNCRGNYTYSDESSDDE